MPHASTRLEESTGVPGTSVAPRTESHVIALLVRAAALPLRVRLPIGLVVVALAALIDFLVTRWLRSPGDPLRLVEAVAVLIGVALGVGPGLAALAVAVAYTLLHLPPHGWAWPASNADVVGTVIVGALGVLTILGAHAWQVARQNARAAVAELRAEVGRRRAVETRLEQQNEELARFGHRVAHDLKEPLRGVSTLARFLLEDIGPQLSPRDLDHLQRLAQLPVRLASMIEGLLAYAETLPDGRASSARAEPERAVRDAVEVLGQWLEERHAKVLTVGPLPPVAVEPALLTRIFTNLIANAVKYNRSATPRVWVSARPAPASAPAVAAVYCVRDNGIGIAPTDREKVFELFKRLHPQGAYGGGTGAGLALTRRLIERLGGRLWIEDPPAALPAENGRAEGEGPGALFCFTLPPPTSSVSPTIGTAAAAGEWGSPRFARTELGIGEQPAAPERPSAPDRPRQHHG